jgi:hypothetical protein
VREDKFLELRFGELYRNRRRCWLCCYGAHQARASWEAGWYALENRIASETTRG